jgi:hypothetical protein
VKICEIHAFCIALIDALFSGLSCIAVSVVMFPVKQLGEHGRSKMEGLDALARDLDVARITLSGLDDELGTVNFDPRRGSYRKIPRLDRRTNRHLRIERAGVPLCRPTHGNSA